ncbi:helix-turn-helix transcriptional regulator [Lampropedia puyangensis]|uniref:Helix-turn-helix transcriptional regulator n=1 Tax=Lampropedia puyangensis TaxID=1330072 RepID=A0A4S8FAZ0_9BURK|nr:AraC family transcriptional regulator [Lampropedia puyangensis]THU03684.1 helix-turn-helix transcriptional regulator [Lampropedia puyangensis]
MANCSTPPSKQPPKRATATTSALLYSPEIGRSNPGLNTNYWFLSQHMQTEGMPLLQGLFRTVTVANGLILHMVDATDLVNGATESEITPSIKLVFLCDGCSEVAYANNTLCLEATAEAHIIAIAKPDRFHREWRNGRRERKVSLTIPWHWLHTNLDFGPAAYDAIWTFAQSHGGHLRWAIPASLMEQANALFESQYWGAHTRQLQEQAVATQLSLGALSHIAHQALATVAHPPAHAIPTREARMLQRIHQLLHSGQADGLPLPMILRKAGTSSSRIQQRFQQVHGMTITAYLRRLRLQKAYCALRSESISIMDAATLAGYHSAENFATAFKREFGLSPSGAARS